MLAVADSQVQGAAAACLASMTIEVDSKVAVMEAAGPALIQLVKEGQKVGTRVCVVQLWRSS